MSERKIGDGGVTQNRDGTTNEVLRLVGLRVSAGRAGPELVHGINLTVRAGECVAIVGDSGAGKSLIARAALGLLPDGLTATVDLHEVVGWNMRAATEGEWRRVLGQRAGYVHQDALGALDPLMRVGPQTSATLRRHHFGSPSSLKVAARTALANAGLPDPGAAASAWPHELSGGMRQRAVIAGAVISGPRLLVADEPTTALDATLQHTVLTMMRLRVDEPGAEGQRNGLLMVSHDLIAVSQIADRVLVLSGGEIVEEGDTDAVLANPQHPVTRALLDAARPRRGAPAARERERGDGTGNGNERRGQREAPTPAALTVIDLAVRHPGATFDAISGVNFVLPPHRTLGVLGESGAGKSSLAAALLGTRRPVTGQILFTVTERGSFEQKVVSWGALPERSRRPLRHLIQLVPQAAAASFSPGARVGTVLAEAIGASTRSRGHIRLGRRALVGRVVELLHQVGLDPALRTRHADTLSGGQAQRLAIARALASSPSVLVCDEAVSALDATVQTKILDLLDEIQRETGVAIVFISHDLAAVRRIADDVLVMRGGEVVEQGATTGVFRRPQHAFTRELLSTLPTRRSARPGETR
jgi:peptide/nickel transport system ATP-binding protein